MAELLLFQLHGPPASWGEPAVGEYRPSTTHLGKSQIAGLLGAPLGLTHDREAELAALADDYGLAVRIDAEGELLRDYHTTQIPPARRGRRFATRRDELAVDDRYTILSRRGGREIRFSTLDFTGLLTVTDPDVFLDKLEQGIGPAKAFGCGLMLLKRA